MTGKARAEAKDQEEIERLAKEGNVEAQFQLGTNLFNTSHAESWKWFCSAAMSGHEGARAATGLFYEYGLNPVEANSVTALMWYRLAGKVGEKQAKKLESEIKADQIIKADQLAQQWRPSNCPN